jgi:hypothetical protein
MVEGTYLYVSFLIDQGSSFYYEYTFRRELSFIPLSDLQIFIILTINEEVMVIADDFHEFY